MLNNKYKLTTIVFTLVLFIIPIQFVFSQVSIGGSFGFQIPGRQDLKFKKFNPQGELIQNIKTSYVQSNISTMRNLHITYWRKKFGLRLEYLAWEHNSVAKQYLTDELPEFNSTEQSREGIYLCAMMRMQFPFKSTKHKFQFGNRYSYFGIGYGGIYTEIDRGLQKNIRSGIQMNYGISIPITKRLRALGEFKYILTRDADNITAADGVTVVDTSGHWTLFRLGPHIDTKYHVIQIGIQWNIFNKKVKNSKFLLNHVASLSIN